MKKITIPIFLFILTFALIACGNSGDANLDKLNGKWDAGLFVMEINTKAKTIKTVFGNVTKDVNFTVNTATSDNITVTIDGGQSVFVFQSNDRVMMTEKSSGKQILLTRVK